MKPFAKQRRDNLDRLCRSLKYEAVYLHELTGGFKAERVMDRLIVARPHKESGR